jgi:hypothetical protein
MSYWNGDLSNIMAEALRTRRLEGFAPHDYFGRTFKGDAIAWNSHFPSRGNADALVRLTCADG